MIRSVCIILLFSVFLSCSKDYNPSAHLTPAEQDLLMDKLIRYLAKAPEGLSMAERFYPAYNAYYDEQKSKHRLDAYYRDDREAYFLVSRPAPSITEKRVSTGGKITWCESEITDYEEIFRTWKMPDSTLVKKGLMLFDKMVKGESLDPYLTKNSAPEEYIEFPDERTYFDKTTRTWKAK